MSNDEKPTVLLVDDETRVVDGYELWLDDDYRKRKAYNGEEALEQMDETVDIVLLDRRMPGLNGDEVLEHIRENEDYQCRVAMVTAVDPDFDIVEMPFDAYLTKPVRRDDLNDVVERLLTVSDYDSAMQEYYALVEKRVALESSKQKRNLDESSEYEELVARISTLEADLDEMLSSADDAKEIFRQEF